MTDGWVKVGQKEKERVAKRKQARAEMIRQMIEEGLEVPPSPWAQQKQKEKEKKKKQKEKAAKNKTKTQQNKESGMWTAEEIRNMSLGQKKPQVPGQFKKNKKSKQKKPQTQKGQTLHEPNSIAPFGHEELMGLLEKQLAQNKPPHALLRSVCEAFGELFDQASPCLALQLYQDPFPALPQGLPLTSVNLYTSWLASVPAAEVLPVLEEIYKLIGRHSALPSPGRGFQVFLHLILLSSHGNLLSNPEWAHLTGLMYKMNMPLGLWVLDVLWNSHPRTALLCCLRSDLPLPSPHSSRILGVTFKEDIDLLKNFLRWAENKSKLSPSSSSSNASSSNASSSNASSSYASSSYASSSNASSSNASSSYATTSSATTSSATTSSATTTSSSSSSNTSTLTNVDFQSYFHSFCPTISNPLMFSYFLDFACSENDQFREFVIDQMARYFLNLKTEEEVRDLFATFSTTLNDHLPHLNNLFLSLAHRKDRNLISTRTAQLVGSELVQLRILVVQRETDLTWGPSGSEENLVATFLLSIDLLLFHLSTTVQSHSQKAKRNLSFSVLLVIILVIIAAVIAKQFGDS